ncbi:MAG: UbiD family decarboxylase domain-containing protein, partial [Geminicoccaceae bacterium]
TDHQSARKERKGRPGDRIEEASDIGLDQAAAHFAAAYAGPPAASRTGGEPAVRYPIDNHELPLLFGTYGDEGRIRRWLPGLPARIAPDACNHLKNRALPPSHRRRSDHDRLPADLGLLPIPRATLRDAGRYVTMGFALAYDVMTGKEVALSAHRMLAIGADHLGLWMLPSRRLRRLRENACRHGLGLPITVNIGAPPAAVVSAATNADGLPPEMDKLNLAGALANQPLELTAAPSGAPMFAMSDIVIDGVLTGDDVDETNDEQAVTMPEFLGYDGRGRAKLAVMRVTSIAFRPDASFMATIGPGREQSSILGLGGALSLALSDVDSDAPTRINDLRFSHAGGGMLLLFVSVQKQDDVTLEPLARRLIEVCPFTKIVVFVDEDVSVHSEEDVLWAMTTRAQLAVDMRPIEGFPALHMDPSQSDGWCTETKAPALKTMIDATIPVALRSHCQRSFSPH